MAQRKPDNLRRSPTKADRGLKALYAKMRQEFSAADLQKYTEIDESVPARQILAELKRIHRRYARKRVGYTNVASNTHRRNCPVWEFA